MVGPVRRLSPPEWCCMRAISALFERGLTYFPPLPGGRVEKPFYGYIFLLNAALIVWRPAGLWVPLFAVHCGIWVAISWLAHRADRRRSGAIHFFYLWYPQLCFLFFFEEVHLLARFIRPQWFDAFFIEFDYRLFGTHPTVWFEQIAAPGVTEFMSAMYFSYYLMIPLVGGALHYRKRWMEFEDMMVGCVLGYTTCYAIFYLVPVEGPYHTLRALQQVELHGGFFAAAMDLIEKYGRIHGGAFPSAHVVGAVVPWFAAWRHCRSLAIGMTPFVFGVFVSTVYGRYHYAVDILGGILVGTIAYWLALRWSKSARIRNLEGSRANHD